MEAFLAHPIIGPMQDAQILCLRCLSPGLCRDDTCALVNCCANHSIRADAFRANVITHESFLPFLLRPSGLGTLLAWGEATSPAIVEAARRCWKSLCLLFDDLRVGLDCGRDASSALRRDRDVSRLSPTLRPANHADGQGIRLAASSSPELSRARRWFQDQALAFFVQPVWDQSPTQTVLTDSRLRAFALRFRASAAAFEAFVARSRRSFAVIDLARARPPALANSDRACRSKSESITGRYYTLLAR